MGSIKDTAMTSLTLMELAEKGEAFCLTFEPSVGFSWFRPNTGEEYVQDDWIFHALERGSCPTLDEAVERLASAIERSRKVTELRPRARKAPARKAAAR